MRTYDIRPLDFRIADFVRWQREGQLELQPAFQRRSVWKRGAKSYFIDTLVRGLPVPLIIVRERIDLDSQDVQRQIVDGQQRLRTIFAYVDRKLLRDFEESRDDFVVSRTHNDLLAGKRFRSLPEEIRTRLLGYRLSVQVLPSDMEDREVLQIFARLNSTGLRLNDQELRNAEYFGVCKSLMYELAYEQLERWMEWGIFSSDDLSRMKEVEMTSDLALNIWAGLTPKTKSVLDGFYADYDESMPRRSELSRRFRHVMDLIDENMPDIKNMAYRRQMHFFTLFVFLYDLCFGLGSDLTKAKPKRVHPKVRSGLQQASDNFLSGRLPRDVLEAVSGAATDLKRRRVRLSYVAKICKAAAGR